MNDVINAERLPRAAIGDVITLDQVLLVGTPAHSLVGRPLVPGARVTVRVAEQTQDAKTIIFKKKRRKGYQRKTGFRKFVTILEARRGVARCRSRRFGRARKSDLQQRSSQWPRVFRYSRSAPPLRVLLIQRRVGRAVPGPRDLRAHGGAARGRPRGRRRVRPRGLERSRSRARSARILGQIAA